jgi:glycosyltransferase involved in cell wall biosynthesis
VLVYNLSPIYNQFLLWLRRQPRCPKLFLLLLDSTTLGQAVPRFKQFRRRLKPMYIPDQAMLPVFDACIGLSSNAGKYFRSRQVPFLWMPGGCTPERALRETLLRNGESDSPHIRFGYFGALGDHSGVEPLIQTFLMSESARRNTNASLEICGYGKLNDRLGGLLNQHPMFKYHGLITPAECLRFGQSCDVLVNPRPLSHGNENNFASKVFEYALTGRPILTSNLSGVEAVLGPDAYYFDAHDFHSSLSLKLLEVIATPKAELDRRGAAIQQRILTAFSWEKQAARLARFIYDVSSESWAKDEVFEALAA